MIVLEFKAKTNKVQVGHTGTWLLDSLNASGDETSTVLNSGLTQQVMSKKEESKLWLSSVVKIGMPTPRVSVRD